MRDLFHTELIALLPRLRRFALGLTAEPSEADDLVQAACERALTRCELWRPGTRLDSWMFRITQNIWIDRLRAKGPITELDTEQWEQLPGQDWQQGFEAKLQLQQVLTALQQLPPTMRTVLTLVCIDGMSYQDAASTLELPIGTVMSRLARARATLHSILGETHVE